MLCMLVRFHASSLWVLVKQFGEDLERESEKKFPSQPFFNEVVREAFLFCVNCYGN